MTPKKNVEKERKTQVIQAALDLISDDGLETITLDKIAEKAGVSKGILTYYFKSKHELLLASFEAFLEFYNQNIMAAYSPEMSVIQIFDMMIDFIFTPAEAAKTYFSADESIADSAERSPIRFSPGQAARLMVLFYSKAVLEESFRSIFLKHYEECKKGIEETFIYAQQNGEFKTSDPELTTLGLMAMMDGLALYHLIGLTGLNPEKSVKICKEFIRSYLL